MRRRVIGADGRRMNQATVTPQRTVLREPTILHESAVPRESTVLRERLQRWSVFVDIIAALASYEVALILFAWIHHGGFELTVGSFDWGLPLALAAGLASFTYCGLYKMEAWVSRPVHVMEIFRATLIALVVTTFFTYTFRAPIVVDSRLTVLTAFVLFFVLDTWLRVSIVDRIYSGDVRDRPGATMVIGFDAERSMLVSRLKELRGFGRIVALQPLDRRRNGFAAEAQMLWAIKSVQPAPRQVFIDGPSVGHKATFDLIAASYARGAQVYLEGRLASELDTTRLLKRLFQLPVTRVYRDPVAALQTRGGRAGREAKRMVDVSGSALALALLAPVFAVIALLIKRDSPGPVFFRQERVGRDGAAFAFLKFRSMKVSNDESAHRDYVCGLIEKGEVACFDEQGVEVYKLVGDDRVTRVGRVLRKYSLDELPQFWNVLRGDMSIIGPRPALAYEVDAYKPWHRMRLSVMPGVSGLWQIAGRSRVSFDEMVFQDVMYTYNGTFLTDLAIGLRTVPAVFAGRGAT